MLEGLHVWQMEKLKATISCGLTGVKKLKDSLQVMRTARSWDYPLYPSSLASANAEPASAVLPRVLRAHCLCCSRELHIWDLV